MGVPQEDRMRLFEWSNRMIGAGDPEYMGEEAGSAMVEIFTYSNQLAEKRRDDPRDDIVTKLLNAEIDGDKLSELEFDMFMLLLAVAGNETTRNATAHGMHALLDEPRPVQDPHRRPRRRDRGSPSRRSCAGRRRYCTSSAPSRPTPRSAARRSRKATRS